MRLAGEPCFDRGCFVGGVVIHDDMDVEAFRNASIDVLQNFKNSTAQCRL